MLQKEIAELAKQERRPFTQEQRRQLSERRLLDAATQLIAERGVANTTMSDIGERAGYSRGMVRERFGSKSGLMSILSRDIRERFVINVLEPAVGDSTGLKATEACVDATLNSLLTKDSFGSPLFAIIGESVASNRELKPGVAWIMWSFRERFEAYIEDAIKAGEVPKSVSPKAAALLIVGTLFGITLEFIVDPENVDLDSMRTDVLKLLHHTLAIS